MRSSLSAQTTFPGCHCFCCFFIYSLQTDVHIHLCTLMHTTGRVTALLPGFSHSVDWSWLGPHLGCRNPRPQEVAGHHRRRSRSKETLDAVSAASLLEEAQVRGSPGPIPPHPAGTCQQGHPVAPGAITVIVTIQGEVPGGLSTPESGSTACAATENENTGTRPSPPEFQQQPSTPSGLPVLRCLRPDGFLTQPTHAGEKKPVAFFFPIFPQLTIYSMLTGEGWLPAIIREPTPATQASGGPRGCQVALGTHSLSPKRWDSQVHMAEGG